MFSRGLEVTCLTTFGLGRLKPSIYKFVGVSGSRQSGRLCCGMLLFRYLLFAAVVKGVHDVIEALIYDLAIASHHRH